jgi:hypothetical protein
VHPTAATPGHVYEIDTDYQILSGAKIIDPVHVIATQNGQSTTSPAYHHNGGPNYLLALIDPTSFAHLLNAPAPRPPKSAALPAAPSLTLDLLTLVRAIRDAEMLVLGNLPATFFVRRHDIY